MKKFLIGCGVLVVGVPLLLVIVGLFLPTEFSIDESRDIDATSAEVHMWVGDLAKWPEWSPWERSDPSIVTTLGATTSGVGASQTWTSDSGGGELTLTKSDPATGIAYDMAFIMGDMRVPSTAAMTYAASGTGTTVTWSMEGDLSDMFPPVVAGYFNLLLPGQIAGEFQNGLSYLESAVEAGG